MGFAPAPKITSQTKISLFPPLLLSTESPGVPGTHLNDRRKMESHTEVSNLGSLN